MTVGDVVNGIGALSGTIYYFQPAADSEVTITSGHGYSGMWIGLHNGTLDSYSKLTTSENALSTKICINNTIYLLYRSPDIQPSYSGIQIK